MVYFTISKNLSKIIERVQKSCTFIILGRRATPDYSFNLSVLELDRLDERREKLSVKFAKKTIKHPEHRTMFEWKRRDNIRSAPKFIIPNSKTKRYNSSAIPNLARIINSNILSGTMSFIISSCSSRYSQRDKGQTSILFENV